MAAAKAELGAGLDHLRQPHARALVGVEGHAEGAQADADDDRQDGVLQGEAQGCAGETGDHGGEHEVAGEPEGALVPDLAVALVARHVVDGAGFDLQARRLGLFGDARLSRHGWSLCFYRSTPESRIKAADVESAGANNQFRNL